MTIIQQQLTRFFAALLAEEEDGLDSSDVEIDADGADCWE